MKRALALQMLALARDNLKEVDGRIEGLQADLFAYEDDEVIGPTLTTQIDNMYDRALEARRRTEHLDIYEEDNDE
jgi:hypothetical protein